MKFMLNCCDCRDISFIAEAPEDITLKQLLKQCDKIELDRCSCEICSIGLLFGDLEEYAPEIIIDYDSIRKANDDVPCKIIERDT